MAIKTEYGTDDDGRNLYSEAEHERLSEHTDRMSDADFTDWNRARTEGRVVSEDEDEGDDVGGMEDMSVEERREVLNKPLGSSSSSGSTGSASAGDKPMEDMSLDERRQALNRPSQPFG